MISGTINAFTAGGPLEMTKPILSLAVLALTAFNTYSQAPEPVGKPATDAPIEQVTIHPIFKAHYSCSEHWEGQLPYPGDALGADCIVYGGMPTDGRSGFMRAFKTDGLTNEDWYGWGEPVLAPFDSTIAKININPIVNKPGQTGKPPASFVVFRHADGTMVMVGHVAEITVKEGDAVKAGQPFAKVGNNGFGRAPHIHLGAWRGKTPLQIRFDLRALGKMRQKG
jgi:murein DD-endopeptidase MepM/ murein hydrolase activator NlpD